MKFEPTGNLEQGIKAAAIMRRKEFDELMYGFIQNQQILNGIELRIKSKKYKKNEVAKDSTNASLGKILFGLQKRILNEEGKASVLHFMMRRITKIDCRMNQDNFNLMQRIREQRIKIRDLENTEKALTKKLRQNQNLFSKERKILHKNLGAFFQRLNWHENYLLEEKKFLKLYNRQMGTGNLPFDHIRTDDPVKNLSKKYSALFKVKAIENRLARTLQSTLEEEERYENAFRIIGVRLGELDTTNIVNLCLHHETMLKELSGRAAQQWKKNNELGNMLNHVNRNLQNEFYGADRTTNRDVLEIEKKLSSIKKHLDEEINEYKYICKYFQRSKFTIRRVLTIMHLKRFATTSCVHWHAIFNEASIRSRYDTCTIA
jgi:hypothetical protein